MELLILPSLILAALLVWREYVHGQQVQSLLDRIQFPQTVQAARSPEPTGENLHVPLEDDQAWEDFIESVKNGDAT